MSFVQIIEFKTQDIGPMRATNDSWTKATEGKRTATKQLLARDHNDPDKYYALVFFDSYESAMKNSSLPETQAAAKAYAQLAEGPPQFRDLDIIEEMN
ncbi:MAG TPA: hypothetical protein VFI65_11520 [Streptosporangiaceae bacterium]|nr:hypothetical protein [Streptosporangiaceae bacterium]